MTTLTDYLNHPDETIRRHAKGIEKQLAKECEMCGWGDSPKCIRCGKPNLKNHTHRYYLKSESFDGPYYRECIECGHKTKPTKYRMGI